MSTASSHSTSVWPSAASPIGKLNTGLPSPPVRDSRGGRRAGGRMGVWVENIAGGKIQRQAKAEALPRSHLPDRAKHALGCDQVEPPELVVFAEITPVRLGR